MRLVALEACFYCYGRKTHDHEPMGLTVVSTVRMDRLRVDYANRDLSDEPGRGHRAYQGT